MKDNKNSQWTLKDIAHQYKIENPKWSWKKCWNKADVIHRELNSLNYETWDKNKLYFKRNLPFSNFDSRDSEFGNKSFDYNDN